MVFFFLILILIVFIFLLQYLTTMTAWLVFVSVSYANVEVSVFLFFARYFVGNRSGSFQDFLFSLRTGGLFGSLMADVNGPFSV